MPEHRPRCRLEAWWRAEDVQIGAANPRRLNVQENITRPAKAWHGSLNKFQFADAGEHCRWHRRCCSCHATFLLSSEVLTPRTCSRVSYTGAVLGRGEKPAAR